MTLAELHNRDPIFIDANIFIYHFSGSSRECKIFLERCARQELLGFTSTSVLAEVLHRLMIAEAVEKRFVTSNNAVKKLRNTPSIVKGLTLYYENTNCIPQMNISIFNLTLEIVQKSTEIRKNEGLLTNDSLVIAFMNEQELTKVATANGDFDRVSGIDVYKPADIVS